MASIPPIRALQLSYRPPCETCCSHADEGSKIPVLSRDSRYHVAKRKNNDVDIEQRGDSPVLVMHDGVTLINYRPLDSSKKEWISRVARML